MSGYDRGHCWVRRLSRSVQPQITLLLKPVLVGGGWVEQGIGGPACETHHGWLQRRVRQRFKVRAVLVKEPLWSQVATAPASGVEEERKISLQAHKSYEWTVQCSLTYRNVPPHCSKWQDWRCRSESLNSASVGENAWPKQSADGTGAVQHNVPVPSLAKTWPLTQLWQCYARDAHTGLSAGRKAGL